MGSNGWTVEAWIRRTTNGVLHRVFTIAGSSGTGVRLQLGATNVATIALSSNNSTEDISGGTSGTATITNDGVYHHIALTYDPVAGRYYYYSDGVVDITVVSTARIHQTLTMFRIGANFGGTDSFPGNIDEFQFSPYCKYPNGTTFTPTTTAATVSGDFFSIPEMKMYSMTSASASVGVNPGMTVVQRVYIGEVVTGTVAVSSAITYALEGVYHSIETTIPDTVGTKTTVAHNIGMSPRQVMFSLRCKVSEAGYIPGDEIIHSGGGGNTTYTYKWATNKTRVSISFTTSSTNSCSAANLTTGADQQLTPGRWRLIIDAEGDGNLCH